MTTQVHPNANAFQNASGSWKEGDDGLLGYQKNGTCQPPESFPSIALGRDGKPFASRAAYILHLNRQQVDEIENGVARFKGTS